MRRKTNIQSLNSTYQTNVRHWSSIFIVRKQCVDRGGCFRRGPPPIIVIKSRSTHHNHKYSTKKGMLMSILCSVQVLGPLTSIPLGAVLVRFSTVHENSYPSQILSSLMVAVPSFTNNPASLTRQTEGEFLNKMNLTYLVKLNSHSCSNRWWLLQIPRVEAH